MSPSYESETRIQISPGKTELIDDFFRYWEKNSSKFAQVHSAINNRKQHFSSNKNIVASVKIVLDRKKIVYGRVADTVFMGLESIGGFYESIHIIGHVLVFFIS
jgi:hypothetical protein